MKVHYVLSGEFDYVTMICDDAGPLYAERQGFSPLTLSDAHSVADAVHVFDNRLTAGEFATLHRHVELFPQKVVFLKIVDPDLAAITQPYYQELLALSKYPNVEFVGPYHAIGFIDLLRRVAGRENYFWLPYCYDNKREVTLNSAQPRSRRLFLSGTANPTAYPQRWSLYKAQRRSYWGWRHVAYLPHPGYADIGMPLHHRCVGESFIAAASRHVAMWVDGSSLQLELLKYVECAYAGCAPFGEPPATLPLSGTAEIWPVQIGREQADVCTGLGRAAHLITASAVRYRQAIKETRNPQTWRDALINHWHRKTTALRAASHAA
jgi:hypothetical protein